MTPLLASVPMRHPHFSERFRPNWQDGAWVHRAVMGLFSEDLPGPEGARRAKNGILFRVERRRQEVLIQSMVELRPEVSADPAVRVRSLAPLLARLADTSDVLVTVKLNAVKTVNSDRGPRRSPIPAENLVEWAVGRVPGVALTPEDVLRFDHRVEVVSARGKRTPLNVVDLTAHAQVVDPVLLSAAVVSGVGRGRAFGCGMLCVVPVGQGTTASV